MKITKFVGQLLSPAVERDVLALLGDRCPDQGTWPEGTVVSADGSSVTLDFGDGCGRTRSTGRAGTFDPAVRERRWFVRVAPDGTVTAADDDDRTSVEAGKLARPLVTFFADWKDCDANVMTSESWAMALWYRDDLAAWHTAEASRLAEPT